MLIIQHITLKKSCLIEETCQILENKSIPRDLRSIILYYQLFMKDDQVEFLKRALVEKSTCIEAIETFKQKYKDERDFAIFPSCFKLFDQHLEISWPRFKKYIYKQSIFDQKVQDLICGICLDDGKEGKKDWLCSTCCQSTFCNDCIETMLLLDQSNKCFLVSNQQTIAIHFTNSVACPMCKNQQFKFVNISRILNRQDFLTQTGERHLYKWSNLLIAKLEKIK